MDNKEKLIDRIRKLLALGKSPNQHEAEAAMTKANELLTEHQIGMSEVQQEEVAQSTVRDGPIIKESETYRSFAWQIARAAGTIFDCEVILGSEQASFYFIGLPEDITLAQELNKYLFDSWKAIVAADTIEWKKDFFYPLRQYEVKKYKIGHGQGFAEALMYRAFRLVKERKDKLEASTRGTALVVMKNEMIKAYKEKQNYKKGGGYKQQSDGYADGRQRGEKIPLGGALSNNKNLLEGD